MNPKLITSFASGLLVASTVTAIVYFANPQEVTSTKPEEKLTVEELKNLLTSEGYVIHTPAEWEEVVAAKKEAEATAKENEKSEKETTEKKTAKEAKDEAVYRTVVTVSEGMTSIDVGRALVSANIIENAWDFTQEVEKRGVAKYLKLGTYEINSNMSTDEVISTIFNR